MIFNNRTDIINMLQYNLIMRLTDYKNIQSLLPIRIINSHTYIITSPQYNKYNPESYTEPNRYEIISNLIDNLPLFNNFSEFCEILDRPEYQYFNNVFFSKGTDRIKSLIHVSDGIVNTGVKLVKFNSWDHLSHDQRIGIITMWMIYAQVFSDCNHRTAAYIMSENIQNRSIDIQSFTESIRPSNIPASWGDTKWYDIMLDNYKRLRF